MKPSKHLAQLNKPVVLLDKTHHKKDFDCGIDELNVFLREQAGQKLKYHQSKTYILSADDEQTIIGYFTLANTRLDWHHSISTKYKTVNTAALIARLAVDKRYQGQNVGKYLLLTALKKLMAANEIIPIPIIVVDAKDGASEFYAQFGFQPLDYEGNRLFILMETLLKQR